MNHYLLFADPIAPWHLWFAWFPVWTWDSRFTWLRTIKRRRVQKHSYLFGAPCDWWEYEREDGYAKEAA